MAARRSKAAPRGRKCSRCDGMGRVVVRKAGRVTTGTCPRCKGKGRAAK